MSQKEKISSYGKLRRDRNKKFAVEFLGGMCAKCGHIGYLEFDHIDRKTKTISMSTALVSKREVLLRELQKCQLLCKPCHVEKSSEEAKFYNRGGRGRKRTSPAHGCLTSYRVDECRCDECVDYYRSYTRNYYKKCGWYKKDYSPETDSKSFKHGTEYAYIRYKCRCDSCSKAYEDRLVKKREVMRLYRLKKKV